MIVEKPNVFLILQDKCYQIRYKNLISFGLFHAVEVIILYCSSVCSRKSAITFGDLPDCLRVNIHSSLNQLGEKQLNFNLTHAKPRLNLGKCIMLMSLSHLKSLPIWFVQHMFRLTSKKTSKLNITVPLWGESSCDTRKLHPCDDVFMTIPEMVHPPVVPGPDSI